jgi:hypothetical protein
MTVGSIPSAAISIEAAVDEGAVAGVTTVEASLTTALGIAGVIGGLLARAAATSAATVNVVVVGGVVGGVAEGVTAAALIEGLARWAILDADRYTRDS